MNFFSSLLWATLMYFSVCRWRSKVFCVSIKKHLKCLFFTTKHFTEQGNFLCIHGWCYDDWTAPPTGNKTEHRCPVRGNNLHRFRPVGSTYSELHLQTSNAQWIFSETHTDEWLCLPFTLHFLTLSFPNMHIYTGFCIAVLAKIFGNDSTVTTFLQS